MTLFTNAQDVLDNATIVCHDNAQAFAEAIERLFTNQDILDCLTHTNNVRLQFIDGVLSWEMHSVSAIAQGTQP